ncbi:unnamed protein product [Rotaria sp. Silwood1]|nr:unnamed protein product [Rotaria sp. Silwood1]
MSNDKFGSHQSSSTSNDNEFNYRLTDDLTIKINDIIRNNNYRLFFDENLSYDQLMYLLNNRFSIESGAIDFIIDQIHQLIPDENTRQVFLTIINRFAGHLRIISSDTRVIHQPVFFLDDDSDDDVDDDSNDSSSISEDSFDDLENDLLDEFDFEHFLAVARYAPGG